jgi:hypothetical protein
MHRTCRQRPLEVSNNVVCWKHRRDRGKLHGPLGERRYRSFTLQVARCVKGLFCLPNSPFARLKIIHSSSISDNDNRICRLRVYRKYYRKYIQVVCGPSPRQAHLARHACHVWWRSVRCVVCRLFALLQTYLMLHLSRGHLLR